MSFLALLLAVSSFAFPGNDAAHLTLSGDAALKDGIISYGGDGQATIADSAGFNITPAGLSMSIVVRTRPLDGKSRLALDLFSKGREWLFALDAAGRLHVDCSQDGKWAHWQATPRGGKKAPDGVWAHYAATFTRIQRQGQGETGYLIKLFQNGELVASRELLHFEPSPSDAPVRFGRGLAGKAWALCGDVADAKVWKRALTDDEIERDAMAGGRVKTPGVSAAVAPEFAAAVERLEGEDAPWMKKALLRAAKNGADQTVLKRGIPRNGKPPAGAPVWKIYERPRYKALVLLQGAGRAFPLAGVYDRVLKREIFGRRTFGWQIDRIVSGEAGKALDTDAEFARGVTAADDAFAATWRHGGVTVRTDFRLKAGRIETSIRVDNADAACLLRQVTYPSVSLARLDGNDRIVIPFMGGVEHAHPVDVPSAVADQEYQYPSSNMNLQMGAYYNDAGGVYYAMEDPTACLKRIATLGRRGDLDVRYTVSVGFADGPRGGNGYVQAGWAAVEPFSGDWYDAAQIYKRFLAAEAPWWVKDLPRTETPEWFRDQCVWMEHRISSSHRLTEELMRTRILRMRKFFELPVGIHTRYYVDHAKCGQWPHFAPDPERMKHLDALRRHGVRVTGYIDDRLWRTTDAPSGTNDFMYGALGSHYRIIRETGETPQERYASWFYEKGARGWYKIPYACDVMCPAARGWQEWLTWQCEGIAGKAHLDGIYHDQIMAAIPFACFNPEHGHPFNDAQTWVAGGYTPYLREMRRRTARLNPDTVHGSEDGAEPYCAGQLDFCLNWRWTHEMVPLYVSLYAGRFQYYGRVLGDTLDPNSDRGGFFAKLAEELVWGEQIGEFAVPRDADEIDDREATLYAKRAAHVRHALLGYLNASEFLRPPRFRRPMPRVAYRWNAYRGGSGGGDRPIRTDVVRATAWERVSDRARMAVFANSEAKPRVCEPVLPGFTNALVLVDGRRPVRVTDGAFRLELGARGFAVVVSGSDELLAAEEKRLAPRMRRIAAFTPEPLDSACEFAPPGSRESKPPPMMGEISWKTAHGGERKQPLYAYGHFKVRGTEGLSLHDGGTLYARVRFPRASAGRKDNHDGICMKNDEFLLARNGDGVYFNMMIGGTWSVKAAQPKIPVGRWVDVAVTVERGPKAYAIRYYLDGRPVQTAALPFGAQLAADRRVPLRVGTCWGEQWSFRGEMAALRFFDAPLAPDEIKALGSAESRGAAHADARAAEGWENVCADRREVPPVKTLWTADLTDTNAFAVSWRDGGLGTVTFAGGRLHIVKTNDVGAVVVTSRKPFAYGTNRLVRMFADLTIADANVNYSSGYLRAHGKTENLSMCTAAERFCFWGGGEMTSRGMPCTAPGMTTRKYAQYKVEADGLVTPALVVAGHASDSTWSGWTVEDFDAAHASWQKFIGKHFKYDYAKERLDEKAFDAMLAADTDHVAAVERRDGVSRLVVDGRVAAPVVYKPRHLTWDPERWQEPYAGKPLDGSEVKIGVATVVLAGGLGSNAGYWTTNGFDAVRAVRAVKCEMRVAPKSLFLICLRCAPYPEFTLTEHPEERWLDADGKPVLGTTGSCIAGYLCAKGGFSSPVWPWVSYSSRVWRDGVKRCIRELVAELRRQGLSKRVVGVHLCGFHDDQFSIPYTDTSAPAKAEYARAVAEGRYVSTNYDFVVKQSGFSAQEEFARTFKAALGKRAVAAVWCESPYNGAINGSLFFTSFVRSDAIDVAVCQPNYRERLPAFPIACAVPFSSFHRHGKMFWNEFDLRTYASYSNSESAKYGPGSLQALGHAFDFPMWQSLYRKLAGEMDAIRMGYWFFDMAPGWYRPPEIAADIRALAGEERALAAAKPSAWRPDLAVVVDEAQFLNGEDAIRKIRFTDDYIYAQQCRYFVSSGVPYESYLMEDVLADATALDGRKAVVFAFMRNADARRQALVRRLAAQGTTQVYLSETGVLGGGETLRFAPKILDGHHDHRVRAAPGVTDNVTSEIATSDDRSRFSAPRERGRRCTVAEGDGVSVTARYVSDGLPAIAERRDPADRRVYVCEPGGLTPGLLNRIVREAGGYAAVDREGLQVNMNGDFVSVHCLRPGTYAFTLPFACRVENLRTGYDEPVVGRTMTLTLTAGETCRFRLRPESRYRVLDAADMCARFARYAAGDDELYTNAYPNARAFEAMRENVPRFACPDETLTDAYYFRWWTYRKHLRKTPSGWVVTEFLPDVGWAGKYNTIACPLGHHIREGRWLADEAYLDDYIRFMMTEGTVNGPCTYVNWPAWSACERARVTGNRRLLLALLPRFTANYETWERGWPWKGCGSKVIGAGLHRGLFRSVGDREGTEYALSADGARPMVNAAMWAEATAIAGIAREAGETETARAFAAKADRLAREITSRLWNPDRAFFTTEAEDGTHDAVCELHGYAPFYFRMPLAADCLRAWQPLTDAKGFWAPRGLTFPRRDTPGFEVSHDYRRHACLWNGPSWPYATSVALTALYETLQAGAKPPIPDESFPRILGQYAAQHRLVRADGTTVPWIDENYDPFAGTWLAREILIEADRHGVRKNRYRERGKDYNHATFCDLVIAGLCGFVPREDGKIVVKPLAPKAWNWWCVDGIRYHGRDVTILYDRDGTHYGRGKGLVVLD